MTNPRYPWISDLLDTDAKALGTYLALLWLRIKYGNMKLDQKPKGEELISKDEVKETYATYFAGRGTDARDALEAGKSFIDRVFGNHDILYGTSRLTLLDDLELTYLDRFGKAVRSYLKPDSIPEQFRKLAKQLLLDIRNKNCEPRYVLVSGTTAVYKSVLRDHLKKNYNLTDEQIDFLLRLLEVSGYTIEDPYSYYLSYLFPAACLLDQNLSLLEPEAKPEELIPPAPKPERYLQLKPAKEVLESITRAVLEDLGFEVSTNVMLEARSGERIEVDIWAERSIGEYRFSIYCSCKNWNRKLDSSVINEEHGRVDNLRQLPQLKLIIAKELTREARATAKADGFFVIELGEKADAENTVGAYELIYRTLNMLFTAIAPLRLREMAAKVSRIAEDLRKISEELASLAPVGIQERLETGSS